MQIENLTPTHRVVTDYFLVTENRMVPCNEHGEPDVGWTAPEGAVLRKFQKQFRLCKCGSGLESRWVHDDLGLPLGRACSKCEDKLLSKFNPTSMYEEEID